MNVSSSSLPKLHQAILDNDLQTVKRVLEEKLCDVEQRAQGPLYFGTPMHFAVYEGNIPAAEALLSAGANVNSKGAYNWSPLHWASVRGHDKMVTWLIEHGADVLHKAEHEATALHLAATFGRVVVGDILLSKGVDINCQDTFGDAPYHNAAFFGKDKMVPWLLDNGADVQIKNLKGETALDVANRRGHTETARLIQNNINNAATQREILLSQEVRSRTSSYASTVASGTSSQSTIDQPYDMKEISYQGVAVNINNQDFSASRGMLSNRDGSQHDKGIQPGGDHTDAGPDHTDARGGSYNVRGTPAHGSFIGTPARRVPDDVYNMTYPSRGLVVIINNKTFLPSTRMEERNGTDRDANDLEQLFKSFEVIVDVMVKLLLSVSDLIHAIADCFECAILSHGEEGLIYGIDTTVKIDELTGYVKGDRCRSLIGKPKIFFFIQACRGTMLDHGVDKADAMGEKASPQYINIERIPTEADFLMAHSVVPGAVAKAILAKGGKTIQEECIALDRINMLVSLNMHEAVHRPIHRKLSNDVSARPNITGDDLIVLFDFDGLLEVIPSNVSSFLQYDDGYNGLVMILLLLLAGDVEVNPGPETHGSEANAMDLKDISTADEFTGINQQRQKAVRNNEPKFRVIIATKTYLVVVNNLMSSDVMSSDEADHIKSQSHEDGKLYHLLEAILQKGNPAMDIFVETLRKERMTRLVTLIETGRLPQED